VVEKEIIITKTQMENTPQAFQAIENSVKQILPDYQLKQSL
jgi:hypothetical protein